ncbi:hypothetical protein TTHERM_01298490 (macronuclear) [Tetrahymena thermophila SB210]|uniref:Macro domain-containing protein n=1 Tax=Tetrahymena thermophila (strain SB210) TaxID=312017 RepID=Q22A16_TETTS|nr:hypothetical protein TTHERM_01298490 [Tetrahymena thermophila SB210]EAR82126.3 hypothetical protein TTHERM_01298490 [Tetrahymena thermophila SB210]|eukprot:XP_001029789.3 hypothetical protein TTHERM_01298490 [Tetrahymena thermophila SB210]
MQNQQKKLKEINIKQIRNNRQIQQQQYRQRFNREYSKEMGNLCSESRSVSKIDYQKPSVQYEQVYCKTTFSILQGSFLFHQANILVNAHQAPFTLSPIMKYAKLSTDVSSKQNPPQGTVVHTDNSGQLKYPHILHLSLPFWQSCEDVTEVQAKLYEMYKKVLQKADQLKQESILFTDLTLPPMQIPIGLHAECLIGAVTVYIEENQHKTGLKHIIFINQERNKIQRYTYQLQSKMVGMNENSVKDKIRKSISDICGYNSLQHHKVQLADEKSLQGSQATKNMCDTEGSTVNHSKHQLGLIAEQDIEREDLENEYNNNVEEEEQQQKKLMYQDDFGADDLIDSRHYNQLQTQPKQQQQQE